MQKFLTHLLCVHVRTIHLYIYIIMIHVHSYLEN